MYATPPDDTDFPEVEVQTHRILSAFLNLQEKSPLSGIFTKSDLFLDYILGIMEKL
jgi:hypothetical protein